MMAFDHLGLYVCLAVALWGLLSVLVSTYNDGIAHPVVRSQLTLEAEFLDRTST
jgi:hypothetical protein